MHARRLSESERCFDVMIKRAAAHGLPKHLMRHTFTAEPPQGRTRWQAAPIATLPRGPRVPLGVFLQNDQRPHVIFKRHVWGPDKHTTQ